ncbi:NADPH-dependent 1-acyl dihydroxyacetone phosphate reductase [Umbelopsis nana]
MASERKSVLITGPGGIGHALAKEFHSRGLRVFATGRTVSKIASLQELGIDCVSLVVDDPTSVAECHKEVQRLLAGRGLDFIINNAGKSMPTSPKYLILPEQEY